MKLAAARQSLLLCGLFLLVYGGCNWITAQRHDVGVWAYAWERHIPFVPLMIVPYMSIDLFFVAAPFLCGSYEELRMFSRRITTAIVVAGVFFLAMPLRFSFQRPPVDGWLGLIFNQFRAMDHPFNQFPSLHIALRTILADVYARHARVPLRGACQIWFSLIGASTLLTYQHHVVDVIGGFALAGFCFYLFNLATPRWSLALNPRVGVYYACGAALLALFAGLSRPWGSVLLWPALALGVVAAGYLGLGPGIFRKRGGRVPCGVRVLLAPVLIGQWLSHRHYARRSNRWDAVTANVWLGRALSVSEATEAVGSGVTAVLDLTSEFAAPAAFRDLCYLNIPVLDLTAPPPPQLAAAADFLAEQSARGIVYVHCKAGYSRSATAVGAYLLKSGRVQTPDQAIQLIRDSRPGLILRAEAEQAIRHFHSDGRFPSDANANRF